VGRGRQGLANIREGIGDLKIDDLEGTVRRAGAPVVLPTRPLRLLL
jgi:hypothetical protein